MNMHPPVQLPKTLPVANAPHFAGIHAHGIHAKNPHPTSHHPHHTRVSPPQDAALVTFSTGAAVAQALLLDGSMLMGLPIQVRDRLHQVFDCL
jgi:hypothetical protein